MWPAAALLNRLEAQRSAQLPMILTESATLQIPTQFAPKLSPNSHTFNQRLSSQILETGLGSFFTKGPVQSRALLTQASTDAPGEILENGSLEMSKVKFMSPYVYMCTCIHTYIPR